MPHIYVSKKIQKTKEGQSVSSSSGLGEKALTTSKEGAGHGPRKKKRVFWERQEIEGRFSRLGFNAYLEGASVPKGETKRGRNALKEKCSDLLRQRRIYLSNGRTAG